jgi:hypothetical protein
MPALLFGLVALVACKKDDEIVLTQFNGDDDILVVCVGEDSGCVPVGEIDLHSTNGSTLIGTASVDPPSGPVGTLHTVSVDVDDEWEDEVLLVTAQFLSDRGEQTWDMQQDSANHGNWEVEVESLGEPDEVREDAIKLRLYQDDGTTVETPTTETTETEEGS